MADYYSNYVFRPIQGVLKAKWQRSFLEKLDGFLALDLWDCDVEDEKYQSAITQTTQDLPDGIKPEVALLLKGLSGEDHEFISNIVWSVQEGVNGAAVIEIKQDDNLNGIDEGALSSLIQLSLVGLDAPDWYRASYAIYSTCGALRTDGFGASMASINRSGQEIFTPWRIDDVNDYFLTRQIEDFIFDDAFNRPYREQANHMLMSDVVAAAESLIGIDNGADIFELLDDEGLDDNLDNLQGATMMVINKPGARTLFQRYIEVLCDTSLPGIADKPFTFDDYLKDSAALQALHGQILDRAQFLAESNQGNVEQCAMAIIGAPKSAKEILRREICTVQGQEMYLRFDSGSDGKSLPIGVAALFSSVTGKNVYLPLSNDYGQGGHLMVNARQYQFLPVSELLDMVDIVNNVMAKVKDNTPTPSP